ncbi:hypothetical protein FRC12_007767 [Ceratobasidium sp. 428]|nr:hypothetical protein FRC12_007767 [Ceratobasidium sp. 428]
MALDQLVVRRGPELPTIRVSGVDIAQVPPSNLTQPIALHRVFGISHCAQPHAFRAYYGYNNPYLEPNVYVLNALLVFVTASALPHPAKPFYLTEYGLCPFHIHSTVLPPAMSIAISDDAGSVLPSTTLLHTSANVDDLSGLRSTLANALAAQRTGVHVLS